MPRNFRGKALCAMVIATVTLLGAGRAALSADDEAQERVVTLADCQFNSNPDEFLAREARARQDVFSRTIAAGRGKTGRMAAAAALVAPQDIPRKNLIDTEIFARLEKEGVPAAGMASDDEFLRRATLDLCGRIPTPPEIRDFLADTNAAKRDALIDKLINSPEFVDKWTMWLGDLLQNYATTSVQSFSNNVEGRNRMHEWMRASIANGKSFRDIAIEAVAGSGNNYDRAVGQVNWAVKANTPMGPAQDSYDTMMVKTTTAFLGLGHYDCISCHDGRGHLDVLSAWGRKTKRDEAEKMSAFFSRMRWSRPFNNLAADSPNYFYNNSTVVADAAAGQYELNTTAGNRPNRQPYMDGPVRVTNYQPVYRDGTTPGKGPNWRESFGQMLVQDPMFARNFANRLWKAMFGLALADPVDNLDPLRLDPAVEPPAPWTFQASHPELLEKLAQYAHDTDYNLRAMLRLMATSSAWQLSSRYDGEWKLDYVALFARHYPRRMEGEEVHDAIVKATGSVPRYTIGGWADPVSWAMQMPEPVEPRSNGTAAGFMNSFQRGNRDTQFRSQSGSVQMYLSLMNNTFVTDRVLMKNSPVLQAAAKITSDEQLVDELFFTFLSRKPSEYERGIALKRLAGPFTEQYTRNVLIEDLAWTLINKTDFVFSY